jgi:hypothetical protein
MLVVLTNAVKVESVPLNFNFFAEVCPCPCGFGAWRDTAIWQMTGLHVNYRRYLLRLATVS